MTMPSSFTLLAIVSIATFVNCQVEVTPMVEMLDAMQLMMTGDEEFDRDFYGDLLECMNFIDPGIKPSQDGAWQGIIDYWDTRGTIDDPWGQAGSNYIEKNVTVTEIRGMTIYEPCNYASNVAYYHPVVEICMRYVNGTLFSMPIVLVQAMASGFSQLAMGSSFMHGSNTHLGGQQDVSPLGALAYQLHQASLEPLPQSPILHDLSFDYRPFKAVEIIEQLDNMYTNMPVTEWKTYTDSLFIPDYWLVFPGLISTMLSLTLEPSLVDTLIPIAANIFGVPDEYLTFVEDYYIPELRNATANLDLNIIQRTRLLGNCVGTIVKLLYALLWQEEGFLTDNSIFFTPEANRIGMELLPEVNRRASSFQSFTHFSQDFQNGIDVYPGDIFCNPVIPHAKWHLESAIGMLDFVHLADEIHKTLSEM